MAVIWRRGAHQLVFDGSIGCHGGRIGGLVADIEQGFHRVKGVVAEIVPDRGDARHDVGLAAAIADDIMRALRQRQMFAAKIHRHVHDFDGVERAATIPGIAGGVRRLAVEGVFDRDHPVAAGAIAGREIAGNVGEDAGIHILEQPVTDIEGLGAQKLFGNARPDHQPALQMVLGHLVLDGDGRGDDQRHAGIVAFAVAGRAFHNRLDFWVTRNLRDTAQVVLVAAQRDQRAALAPGRGPGRGNAGDALGDLEAVLGENAGDVFTGLEFLEARFAIAEHRVHHDLDLLGLAVNVGGGGLLHRVRRQSQGGHGRQDRGGKKKGNEFPGVCHVFFSFGDTKNLARPGLSRAGQSGFTVSGASRRGTCDPDSRTVRGWSADRPAYCCHPDPRQPELDRC
jgi:hypothetical protein